MQKKKTLETRK